MLTSDNTIWKIRNVKVVGVYTFHFKILLTVFFSCLVFNWKCIFMAEWDLGCLYEYLDAPLTEWCNSWYTPCTEIYGEGQRWSWRNCHKHGFHRELASVCQHSHIYWHQACNCWFHTGLWSKYVVCILSCVLISVFMFIVLAHYSTVVQHWLPG